MKSPAKLKSFTRRTASAAGLCLEGHFKADPSIGHEVHVTANLLLGHNVHVTADLLLGHDVHVTADLLLGQDVHVTADLLHFFREIATQFCNFWRRRRLSPLLYFLSIFFVKSPANSSFPAIHNL